MKIKTAQALVETRFKRPVKDLVYEMYYEMGMSQPKVAKALGVSQGSIALWMKEWGWPARKLMVPKSQIPKKK